jgi:uncharacterized membrane protein
MQISFCVSGWEVAEIALRWGHVFAAIMWVGATYYFTWLDGRFVELEAALDKGETKDKYIWMVHSGGFYLVEKQRRPTLMGQTLHWFKWESGLTWITGMLLFILLYYRSLLFNQSDDATMSEGAAIGLSVGMILGGWVVYDLIWKLIKNFAAGVVVSYAVLVASTWLACRYFSARGAFLQIGAMLGTIMAANVWMIIIPSQRRMVNALKAGQEPNLQEAERAKMRSKHNTFIVWPVVFLMISNHYPTVLGSQYNWVILSALVIVGWIAAKIIRRA